MTNAWTSRPGNARNGQTSFTSAWRSGNYDYAILVRHDWHPIVCQRTVDPIGEWVTKDVYDTVIGLIEVSDSHQGISIAVDPDGIIHVMGNTHDTMNRHIQSVNPHDISSWEVAPRFEKQSKYFTNLVENGVVELNQDGWTPFDSRFVMDRVVHAYGWGSSHGNDTTCRATRLTRSATAIDALIGRGTIRSITGSGFTVTPGNAYNAGLSMRATMASPSEIQHQIWLVFRNGETEISRVASETRNATTVSLWYRPTVLSAVAPEGANNAIIDFQTLNIPGNASAGDEMWADGAMLYEGDPAGDIVYRDGATNGGYQETGWVWNGAPYASTSTGPIRAPGYAGLPMIGYPRFNCFSDGTLILSGSQPVYVNDPVGRGWSLWKKEAADLAFKPLIDGTDGMIMRNTMTTVLQGSSYPVLFSGNPADDDFMADRAYAYGTYIDRNDILHVFCWFRVKTSTAYGKVLYMRSSDKGETFENIHGDPVGLPLEYPSALDTVLVEVDGSAIESSTVGSVAELDGRPMLICNESGTGGGRRLVYWDGSEWKKDDLTSYAFNADSTLAIIRGDIWLFGTRTVLGKGNRAVWGANHSKGTGPILRIGAVNIGTPDGVYEFESGATYETMPVHAGGMDERNNYIYRAFIPDDDNPRIVQFGGGIRSRISQE